MSVLFPMVRGMSTTCRFSLSQLSRQVRQASGFAFRPTFIAREPRAPLPGPSPPARTTPSRKPEELYPESFPLEENDLVNPSGRIYAVKRGPNEDDNEGDRFSGNPLAVPLSEAKIPSIFRPLLFFGLGSTLLLYGAAYYSVKQTDEAAVRIRKEGGGIFDFSTFFGASGNGKGSNSLAGIDEGKMKVAQKQALAEKLGWRLDWLLGWCDQLGVPQGGKQFVARTFTWGAESYLNLPESKSIMVPIVAANVVVFLSWRVSMLPSMRNSLQQFMRRSFLHAPASGRSYTLLTSAFSHRGGLHFLFNTVAMWSFGAIALATPVFWIGRDKMGKHTPESSLFPHFLAFFATAGIFSSLVSHLGTAMTFRFVAARRGLAAAKLSVGRMGSLGASGAVYSTIVLTALAFPDTKVSLIFLPMIPIAIGPAVSGLVFFDICGILFRLRIFDHAGHLGGAAFGFLYFYYGSQVWEACKAQIRQAEVKVSSLSSSSSTRKV